MSPFRISIVCVLLAGMCAPQSSGDSVGKCGDPSASKNRNWQFGKRLLRDQLGLWTSPTKTRTHDLKWILPAVGTTAGLITFDSDVMAHVRPSHANAWRTASDAGVAAILGTAGSLYLFGKIQHNSHARETGILSGEAAVNTLLVNTAIHGISRRSRPDEPQSGDFFVGGTSFPSNHAGLAWSVASVIAHEYPGWGTKFLAYGTASAVSVSRIAGRKHFPSGVFVGSTVGWLIGKQIYRMHHETSLPGSTWDDSTGRFERVRDPLHEATTYVPVDSWVYEAYDRLSALGYAPLGTQNLRPWTRLEFARLLQQVSAMAVTEDPVAAEIYTELRHEFEGDLLVFEGERNLNANVDSVYMRFLPITGTPLTDGLHFGQTIVDDYGRPYQKGLNLVSGFTSRAEAGSIAFYVRGEYQHAAPASAIPESVRSATTAADGLPVAPGGEIPGMNRFRLLESYVALNLSGWQLSFGKQSLWWGSGYSGDLMLSNNAEPLTMIRLSRVSPWKMPLLGSMHTDTFLAQVDGYRFLRLGPSFELTGSYEHRIDPQPFVWGSKISVQPTQNLQIGASITTVFAGRGRPMTFDTFLHTFSTSGNAQAVEPGDRRTGFDFSYRIPGVRNWLVLYSGSMAEDEPNPIAFPRRSAWNPGIYIVQFPGLGKLDLHVESAYTNLPNDPRVANAYLNQHYAGGYTNNGQIMGGWIGPEGRSLQVWSNYWRSAQSSIRVGYREQVVDRSYLGGGRLQDFNGSYTFRFRPDVKIKAGVQYERWKFPILAPTPQSNTSILMQFTYEPSRSRLPGQ